MNQCCLCGRYAEDVDLLMPGAYGCVCSDCAEQAYNISKEYMGKGKAKHIDMATVHTPQEIYDYLNQYVIGQETAKKCLSVAGYNH